MAVAGCQQAEEPIVETTQVVATSTEVTSPEVQPEAAAKDSPELAEPEPAVASVAEYVPPFPERFELFEPPQRARDSVRLDDENGETVELKGFINVDQPLAVLSIDGVISPIPEGGEKYGVQVISIQPPSVIWQRGRNRRTSTLE
jgi:hypothetical protein